MIATPPPTLMSHRAARDSVARDLLEYSDDWERAIHPKDKSEPKFSTPREAITAIIEQSVDTRPLVRRMERCLRFDWPKCLPSRLWELSVTVGKEEHAALGLVFERDWADKYGRSYLDEDDEDKCPHCGREL